MIQTCTGYLHDYFLEVYKVKLSHSISPYTSPADLCTHKTDINERCGELLTDVCNCFGEEYHCTNGSNMLFTFPDGLSQDDLDNMDVVTRIVKWTGHELCEECPVGSSRMRDYNGITDGTQMLICRGNTTYGIDSANFKLTSTFAHELGHTVGCEGDDSGTCSAPNTCVMCYAGGGYQSYEGLLTMDEDVYCSVCDNAIENHKQQYLSTAN